MYPLPPLNSYGSSSLHVYNFTSHSNYLHASLIPQVGYQVVDFSKKKVQCLSMYALQYLSEGLKNTLCLNDYILNSPKLLRSLSCRGPKGDNLE